MKLYIITEGDYSDYSVVGIVDDRTVFDERVMEFKAQGVEYPYDIEEFELNEMKYSASISITIDGHGKTRYSSAYAIDEIEPNAHDHTPKDVYMQGKYVKPWRREQLRFIGYGKDLEQARRVADELRHEVLLTLEWPEKETNFPKDWNRG